MKQMKYLTLLLLAAISCQKLHKPELDDKNTLNGVKCYVYYNPENLKIYSTLDMPLSGDNVSQMGPVTSINYTFPADQQKYNAQTLKSCRLEASIPPTASLVELDASGKELGKGIGGLRDLAGKTVYFKVVAANGEAKRYQIRFRLN